MIRPVSFGNTYINEGSIIAEKEAREIAKRLASSLLGKSKPEAGKVVNNLYTSPYANYSRTLDSAFPNYPSPEASYAISHNAIQGIRLNVVSK